MNINTNIIVPRCLKYKKNNSLGINPYISSLSSYSSDYDEGIEIYIYGDNFLPNSLSRVNFGNKRNIPVVFLNSNTLFLKINNLLLPGVYNISVTNSVKFSARNTTANSLGNLILNSNAVPYTLLD